MNRNIVKTNTFVFDSVYRECPHSVESRCVGLSERTHKIIVETAAYFVPQMFNKRLSIFISNCFMQFSHPLVFTKGCLDNHEFP